MPFSTGNQLSSIKMENTGSSRVSMFLPLEKNPRCMCGCGRLLEPSDRKDKSMFILNDCKALVCACSSSKSLIQDTQKCSAFAPNHQFPKVAAESLYSYMFIYPPVIECLLSTSCCERNTFTDTNSNKEPWQMRAFFKAQET